MDIKVVLILGAFLIGSACKSSQENPTSQNKTEMTMDQEKEMLAQGFVKATIVDETGLDGCSFLIHFEADSTLFLQPQNLKEEWQKDGLKVWLKYRPTKPMANICMKGIPGLVEEIELR